MKIMLKVILSRAVRADILAVGIRGNPHRYGVMTLVYEYDNSFHTAPYTEGGA